MMFAKPGFEITTKILSCDRARFRARQNWMSCEIVHESCTTKIVHDKNRARQKSCMTWVLIRKKFRLIVLKYANYTNLDHLESILINFSAFLEKNYHFTSKNAPKIVDPAKNRARQKFCRENRANRARFLLCTTSCTISVAISNPVPNYLDSKHLNRVKMNVATYVTETNWILTLGTAIDAISMTWTCFKLQWSAKHWPSKHWPSKHWPNIGPRFQKVR